MLETALLALTRVTENISLVSLKWVKTDWFYFLSVSLNIFDIGHHFQLVWAKKCNILKMLIVLPLFYFFHNNAQLFRVVFSKDPLPTETHGISMES